MLILLLQILGVVTASTFAVWHLGIFLVTTFHPNLTRVRVLWFYTGLMALVFAIWQPFVYGWLG